MPACNFYTNMTYELLVVPLVTFPSSFVTVDFPLIFSPGVQPNDCTCIPFSLIHVRRPL